MESQAVFTPEMKNTHTILIPSMLPWHFNLLRAALVSCGYKAEVLDNTERNVVETGLKYVNNDIVSAVSRVAFKTAMASSSYSASGRSSVSAETKRGRSCARMNLAASGQLSSRRIQRR